MARLYTRAEVARRVGPRDAALVIDNVVYDVSGFLEEHPGGPEVLVANAGKDASKCFRDVGHGEDAKRRRARLRVGEVVPEERWPVPPERPADAREEAGEGADAGANGLLHAAGPPLLAAALALLVYVYLL